MIETLRHEIACSEAITWLEAQPPSSPQELWDRCERGDWMLWLLLRTHSSEPDAWRARVLTASLDCIDLVFPLNMATDEQDRIRPFLLALRYSWRSFDAGRSSQLWEARRDCKDPHAAAVLAALHSALSGFRGGEPSYTVLGYVSDAMAYAKVGPDVAPDAMDEDAYRELRERAQDAALLAGADILRKHFPHPPTVAGSIRA